MLNTCLTGCSELEESCENEKSFRILFEEAPIGYYEIDCDGIIRRINKSACRLLRFDAADLIGRPLSAFASPEAVETRLERVRQRIAGEEALRPYLSEYLRRDGSKIVLQTHETLIRDKNQRVVGIRSALMDATEHQLVLDALRESEERYALAVRGANDGLWDWNLKTGKVYYSPRWKSMLGYDEADIGNSPEDWFSRVHPQDLGRLKIEIGLHLEGYNRHFQHEYRIRHKDGTCRWVLCRGLAVRDAEGNPHRIAGSQTDITVRKLGEERLLHDAFHDELTGLPNRALFIERLERAAIRAMRRENYLFAVLFLDLDGFKVINDSLSHQAGDQLLVSIARRLEACLRPEDTIARLGGDEFVILLDDLKNISDATQLSERIQRELQAPFLLGRQQVFTTASIGIASSAAGYRRPEELLRNADTAMYRAKALGKARHEVFHAGLYKQAVERLRIETDLRRALERGELQVHYQPIVRRESGEITTVEALVRWRQPHRGLIRCGRFMPIAEETGLILPIGEWVLRTACAQNKAWQRILPSLRVAVNLSARQFKQPNLVDGIARALEDTGLDAGFLDLELSESTALAGGEEALETIQKLCSMGVRISIDDFGTGYSSLKYLRRFPIDTLKIDPSFVRSVDTDLDNAAIATAVINLGHSLQLNVVAEGVETEEEMEFLCSRGCDQMQGRVFSEPVAAQQIVPLLERRYLPVAPRADAERTPAPARPFSFRHHS